MRGLLPSLLLLGSLACQDTTVGLGPGSGLDASAADATGPSDAGAPIDAGAPSDAGSVPDSGPSNLCIAPRTFSIRTSGFTGSVYEGLVAEVDDVGALTFVNPAGPGEVILEGEVPSAQLTDGLYWAQLDLYRPFWEEARLSLWRVGASGTPVDLALIAFSGGSFANGEVEDVGYQSTAQACIVEARCGDSEALSLEVRVRGDGVVVPFSTRASGPTYAIFNGASHHYLSEPQCEDVPMTWTEGWIALAGTRPTDCASMPRDDCITNPRCMLWGSENQDPSYVCRRALGICEPIVDAVACTSNPYCNWDPGDCYCPEGALCACGGGPAPKCRSTCGGFGGLACPADRYCDDLSVRAPDSCAPPPESVGQCEWSPTTCAGTPSVEVCACGAAGAETFENDCLRRNAGASGPVMGRCAP